jgi:putative transposase
MAHYSITITEELLHGLSLSNGRDEAFSKLLKKSSTKYSYPNP